MPRLVGRWGFTFHCGSELPKSGSDRGFLSAKVGGVKSLVTSLSLCSNAGDWIPSAQQVGGGKMCICSMDLWRGVLSEVTLLVLLILA